MMTHHSFIVSKCLTIHFVAARFQISFSIQTAFGRSRNRFSLILDLSPTSYNKLGPFVMIGRDGSGSSES